MADTSKIDAFILSSPHPAWLATTQGHCVYANPALERLTGFNSDQINQTDWRSFLLEEDRAVASASWQRSLATGTPYRVQTRMRGSDDVPKCVELIAFGHKAGDGAELWLFTGLDLNDVAAQKRPEHEAQIQATLNVIPAYTWYALPSGALTFVNERTANYLGLPQDHPLRFGIDTGAEWDSHTALLHPDDREEARRVWTTCLSTGTAGEFTFRVPSAEGKYRWFLTRAEPLRANDGTLLYWIGVNLDIDDAKRAEDKIREREAELRQILDLTPQHLFVFGPDGIPQHANRAALEYFGVNVDQVLGESRINLVHPDDRAKFLGEREKGLLQGVPHEFEARLLRYDRSFRWFLLRRNPFKDEEGRVARWYGAATDIEDRKRAEEALQQSQFYLAEGQRLAHMGSWAFNAAGFEYWSSELLRIYGLDPSGKPPTVEEYLALVHPEDRAFMKQGITNMLADHRAFDFTKRIVRPDGEIRHVRCVGVPVMQRGIFQGFLGTGMDVTEQELLKQERERLRQLETELAHTNRVSMLGEMAASMAHEIKQPIAAAITSANSCLEWLAHEPPNLDRARAAAARIDKYGNRAAEIIDRIRSFYKKSPPQRELVDVNGIIQEILTLLDSEATRSSVAVRTELAVDLPEIMADRVQLQQVFMNLMLNGIEAMQNSSGELTVKSELQDGQLQFSVSDTGVGLPKEKMDQIFSAFYTTKPEGSGMGLAISRSIVESHGGRLWATSNGRQGAIFQFTLPTEAAEPIRPLA
jgi:PAS domain S-box-containing protein